MIPKKMLDLLMGTKIMYGINIRGKLIRVHETRGDHCNYLTLELLTIDNKKTYIWNDSHASSSYYEIVKNKNLIKLICNEI